MIGETIGGRYEVLRALGEGGMGAVYEAKHNGTGRRVALKMIHPDKLKSPQLLARFKVEARAAGGIESEHVVQVFDVDVDEERRIPFIAMEFLAGEDLGGFIDRHAPLPPDLALRIGVQIALGLEGAHAKGIVHRDIKPANLILSERDGGERRVKIVDFGLAKAFEGGAEKGSSITVSGMLLGSPRYMSPEQASASKAVDARSDIWSLGMVVYELLTGQTAFEGVKPLPKLLEAITTRPVPTLRLLAPSVDLGIATAVERALETRPEKRYQDVASFRAALSAFLPDGWTISESMLRDLPVHAKEVAEAQSQKATVVGRVAQATPPAAPIEQPSVAPTPLESPPPEIPQPALPTKVSGQPSARAPAPRTQRLPRIIMPVEVSGSAQLSPTRTSEPSGTLVSGSVEEPPHTERMPAESRSGFQNVKAIPQAPPRTSRARGLPRGALIAGGLGAALIAILAAKFLSQGSVATGDHDAPIVGLGSAVSSASQAVSNGSSAHATTPHAPSATASQLVGAWVSDAGRRYEGVESASGVDLQLSSLAGVEEQGYTVNEPRFTLTPRAATPGIFDVVDHVRPLPPAGLSYAPSAKATCLSNWTEAAQAPLKATLAGDALTLELAFVTTRLDMFEREGSHVTRCRNLEQSTVTRVTSVLHRSK